MTLDVLVVVTHLLGVGHLTRAAAVARGLASRGHAVTLVTGGRAAPLVRTDGLDVLQLPPVHIRGTTFSDLLGDDGRSASPELLAERQRMLVDAVQRIRPDVVVTELYPFGRRVLAAEFGALLAACRALAPRPLVLASVRDILAAPSKPARLKQANDILRSDYDGVLVHADPGVVPLTASWPASDDLALRVHYTGYVDDPPAAGDTAATELELPRGEILVSGGGSAASRPLFEAALAAAARDPGRRWRLLVGHGVPTSLFDVWRAGSGNVVVERARPDFRALLARCAVSVSQFGYNTALDLLATRARAVVVPFADGGETEQSERARLFSARGLVQAVGADQLTAETLLAAVDEALARPQPHADGIAIDGAERSAGIVEDLAAGRLAPPAIGKPRIDFAPLLTALDRRADEPPLPIWWRDDDAIVDTRALQRLLGISSGLQVPAAIASIPGRAQQELADTLADRPFVTVLVHGLTHANHAPADAKKAEFGAHRPLDSLLAEAAEGLRLARWRFAAGQLLPVFVPPWNRLSPALVPQLPALGFAGLSVANDRATAEPAPGLIQANTHIDPIDWHGTRSLVDPARLVADLAAIVGRRGGQADPEPIGVLTHHLVHDEAIWSFIEELWGTLAAHPGVRLANAGIIFRFPRARTATDGPSLSDF